MELKIIEEAITNEQFTNDVNENFEDWRVNFSVSDSDYENQKIWFNHLIQNFLDLLRDVEDDEELSVLVFSKYVELKCLWKQLNAQVQYQNFKKGMADSNLVLKASLVTYILIAIEPLLHEDDLAEIQSFLTKPIREIMYTKTPNQALGGEDFSEADQLSEQIDSLYYDKEYLFKRLGTCEPEEVVSIIKNMREQVNNLQDEMVDSCVIGKSIQFYGKRKITVHKN
ncbi:MAG: hypothetical protein MUF77_11065 [Leptospira sp.]|nr:hypothetical protein [Leptospira sp.]